MRRLTGWLQGHLTAGDVPWPALWRLVTLWLLAGSREFHDLDRAYESWEKQHPTRRPR